MLTAQELRIGNFVEYYIGEEGIEWEPHGIDAQDIMHCSKFSKTFSISHRPIPLTESILVAAGFARALERKDRWFYKIEKGFGIEGTLFSDGIHFQLQDAYVCIKHLHQLQNLFFQSIQLNSP